MKPKTPKPRVMRANYRTSNSRPSIVGSKSSAMIGGQWSNANFIAVPVAVIPLDDVEALVERAAKAMWHDLANGKISDNLAPARAALTAAGIPCKQRRARK